MGCALLIIDMQMEMLHRIEAGLDHVNGAAPGRIAALVADFRSRGLPVIHIRHCDPTPGSPLAEGAAGYSPMPCAIAAPGEAVFIKHGSSGFVGTGLAGHLHASGVTELVVVGAVAGFCVNTTVRAGSDLGFAMVVVRDGVIGFGLPAAGGTGAMLSAQAVFEVTMAHLESDFARLVDSETLLSRGD